MKATDLKASLQWNEPTPQAELLYSAGAVRPTDPTLP